MDRITHQPPRQQGYGSTSSLRNDSLKHTRKHERRREESNQGTKLPASGGLSGQAGRTVRKGCADNLARCREQSARDTRTVWPGATDRPLKTTDPPEPTREKRTVREDQADRPRGFRTVRYWSSDCPQTGCNEKLKQNRIKPKQSKNTRRTRTSRTVRHQHADCPRSTDKTENSRTLKVNPSNPSPDLPNGRSCWDKSLGHEKRQPRMLYPKNFAS
jgi:hypothetical protein